MKKSLVLFCRAVLDCVELIYSLIRDNYCSIYCMWLFFLFVDVTFLWYSLKKRGLPIDKPRHNKHLCILIKELELKSQLFWAFLNCEMLLYQWFGVSLNKDDCVWFCCFVYSRYFFVTIFEQILSTPLGHSFSSGYFAPPHEWLTVATLSPGWNLFGLICTLFPV